jgi:hypothetical protein
MSHWELLALYCAVFTVYFFAHARGHKQGYRLALDHVRAESWQDRRKPGPKTPEEIADKLTAEDVEDRGP